MSVILGIDVGGTFTDFVLLDRRTGALHAHKQPSTPADPAAAVTSGTAAILAKAGQAAEAVELVVHGTTVALNAILQRRGARLALVVSPGNRDILELARVRIRSSFDFFALPEAPLVERDRVIEIAARIDRAGTPVLMPDAQEYERVVAAVRAMDVNAVAVVLLHAYANPSFEAEVASRLAGALGIDTTASTEIWSASREYERATVAVMNAYVTPIMRTYYRSLESRLRELGVMAPVAITASNGGSVDLPTACDRPIDSILSGPASGVVAAIDAGARASLDKLVTFDMGGTSADIAVAIGREPEITAQSMLGELPLIMPAVNVNAIGAGGGSIVRVDDGGFLKVGPGSAGADPGPACFDRGGTDATLTDCYLACGYFDPTQFAEGQIPLSPARARAALEIVADRLGYDGPDRVERTAAAALTVASSMMATEVRKALARLGHNPAEFTLVPYGGAGPTHAAFLAEQAGLERILIAPHPGLFCALGAAMADYRRDFASGVRLRFGGEDGHDRAACARTLTELSVRAQAWTREVASGVDTWRCHVSADLRYAEQAYDLTITLTDVGWQTVGWQMDVTQQLIDRFHDEHESRYGFHLATTPLELRRLVLSAVGTSRRPDIRATPPRVGPDRTSRPVYLNGHSGLTRVVDRDTLQPGQVVEGPLVIEQADTTIVVPPNWVAERLPCASLQLTKRTSRTR